MFGIAFAVVVSNAGIAQQSAAPQSQEPGYAAVEMPHDADALMVLALEWNGLTGEEIKPWRLKASYTVADAQGVTKEQGTLDEFWAGPHKTRTSYTVQGATETTYITEEGVFKAGILVPNALASEAEREFVQPLPGKAYIEHQVFESHAEQVGSTKLNCISEKPPANTQRIGSSPTVFCFNSDKPILRVDVSGYGSKQTIRNSIVLFQGKYIPKDIRITAQDKTTLTAHLDSLESLQTFQDSDFTPPADAKLLPRKIAISAGVAQGLILHNDPPHYPPDAKAAGVSGTVVIRVQIGPDGHIHDPEVVSGPAQLRQAALDAIQNWVYRPYVLNGETVQVDTIVNIIFKLGH